ncbi:MAG: ribosome maturation factor RimM [Oscillospiraceae bacterium]|nr:ribosome maturation factor RimM [Oscillospiraceae bacterium]
MDKYLEAGQIVGTHGLRGEVRIVPWADSPGFLAGFERMYIDGKEFRVLSARVSKNLVLVSFEGVEGIDDAIRLKGKVVHIDRSDAAIPEGRYFVADLIGLTALDAGTGEPLGRIAEVLSLPSNEVYVIRGAREMLIPAVPDFIAETDIEDGIIKIRVIEGV